MLESFLRLIYPPRCLVCDEIVPFGYKKFICDNCKDVLELIGRPICRKCGSPISDVNEHCRLCSGRNFYFDRNVSLYLYDEPMRKIIHRIKYDNALEVCRNFGILMGENFPAAEFANFDYIVPVPIHKERLRVRGYNQAEILSVQISKCLDVPVLSGVLIRKKDTKPQSGLSAFEREENLYDSFEAFMEGFRDKNILLVDDIFTTGTTLNYCSKVLIENGAKSVNCYCLSLAGLKLINKSNDD